MDSLSTTLRNRTAQRHAEAETTHRLLLDHATTAQGYASLLATMLEVHDPLSDALAAHDWQTLMDGWRPPSRSEHLRSDLGALGWSGEQIAAVPRCTSQELPDTDPLPRAIGALYVIEGAALGGQYVAHWAMKTLGMPAQTVRYYSNDHVSPRRGFRDFSNHADLLVQSPKDIEAAVEAAEQTFALFESRLAGSSLLREGRPGPASYSKTSGGLTGVRVPTVPGPDDGGRHDRRP